MASRAARSSIARASAIAALACCAAAARAACTMCASLAALPAASRDSGGPSHPPGSCRAASPPRCPLLCSGALLCGATGGRTWAPRASHSSRSRCAGVAEPVEGVPLPCLAGGAPPAPRPSTAVGCEAVGCEAVGCEAVGWEAASRVGASHWSPAHSCEGGLDGLGVAGTREPPPASASPTSAAARQEGELRAASGGSSLTALALAPPSSCGPLPGAARGGAPRGDCCGARGEPEACFALRASGGGSIDGVERVIAPPATMLSMAPRDCGVCSVSRSGHGASGLDWAWVWAGTGAWGWARTEAWGE